MIENLQTELSPSEPLFVEMPCALCGETKFKTLYESRIPKGMSPADLRKLYSAASDQELLDPLVECESCHLQQVRPLLNPKLILSGYEGVPGDDFVTQNEYRIRTFDSALAVLEKKNGWAARSEFKVLDIGCAGGAFPRAAAQRGYNAHGLEPNRYMSEFARREYGVKVETGTDIANAFAGVKFNGITLWDVIEHLVDPAGALRTIRTRLEKGGSLVLNYPAMESWPARLMGRRWPFLLSVHIYYFSTATLSHMLKREGFKVVAVRNHYQTLELGYVIQRAIKILPFLGIFGWISKTPLGKLPFTYYLGQKQIVAEMDG